MAGTLMMTMMMMIVVGILLLLVVVDIFHILGMIEWYVQMKMIVVVVVAAVVVEGRIQMIGDDSVVVVLGILVVVNILDTFVAGEVGLVVVVVVVGMEMEMSILIVVTGVTGVGTVDSQFDPLMMTRGEGMEGTLFVLLNSLLMVGSVEPLVEPTCEKED